LASRSAAVLASASAVLLWRSAAAIALWWAAAAVVGHD
jgi:hypothetical protein